jgi:hypothetical protein
MNTYLSKMFNPDELVTYGNQYQTSINPITQIREGDGPLITINPMVGVRRCDDNVISYRNILIESDSISLADQLKIINETGLQFTNCVFSGGKSYHFTICLTEGAESKHQYNQWVKRLYKGLEGMGFPVDKMCGNPSRFTRLPGYIRDGIPQTLMESKEQIVTSEFLKWLNSNCPPLPNLPLEGEVKRLERISLTPFARNFVNMGAISGQFNHSLFKASCEARECGYSEDEWTSLLIKCLPDKMLTPDSVRTIKGVYRK